MLKPRDITEREFSTVFWGYGRAAVDEFLEKIAESYYDIVQENTELREELEDINFQLSHFRRLDETLNNTLAVVKDAVTQARQAAEAEVKAVMEGVAAKVSEGVGEGHAVAADMQEKANHKQREKDRSLASQKESLRRYEDFLNKVKEVRR